MKKLLILILLFLPSVLLADIVATSSPNFLRKTGGTISGKLTTTDIENTYGVKTGTMVVTGSTFSVGTSTLVVSGGKVFVRKSAITTGAEFQTPESIDISVGALSTTGVDGIRIQNTGGNSYIDTHGTSFFFRGGAGGSESNSARTIMAFNNASGNVGIGTTAPISKLNVSSGSIVQDGTGGANKFQGTVMIGTGTTANVANLDVRGLGGSSNYVMFASTSADGVGKTTYIDNSGILNLKGINNTLSMILLNTAGGTAARLYPNIYGVFDLYNAAGSASISLNGSATGISYFNTGNVGIGTTAPDSKLHVSSGVMTLDGTGCGINNQGSYSLNTSTTSANFTFGTGNFQHIIISSNGVTGTLPAISTLTSDRVFECKNMGAAAVTINPTGADTIDGEASDSITYKANMVYTANRILNVWIKR